VSPLMAGDIRESILIHCSIGSLSRLGWGSSHAGCTKSDCDWWRKMRQHHWQMATSCYRPIITEQCLESSYFRTIPISRATRHIWTAYYCTTVSNRRVSPSMTHDVWRTGTGFCDPFAVFSLLFQNLSLCAVMPSCFHFRCYS
jgi:hypothetical protein